MLRVGRGRSREKDLPLGVYPVKGRYYVRPVNKEMRRIFAARFAGKNCAPLGADKAEARKLWVKLFITDLPQEDAAAGTVGELIERYERDVLPTLTGTTKDHRTAYCKRLKAVFGHRRYARSEAEASTGAFLRTMDFTQYLRAEAKREFTNKRTKVVHCGRPVGVNREVKCLSRIFKLAKTEWGLTEYNPCLQLEYNPERPRRQYHDDDAFMAVYEKASATMQCLMDLAQMNGARRGMLLRITLADADFTKPHLRIPLNKLQRDEPPRYRLVPWSDDLVDVIRRALAIRAKVRGGKKAVADLETAPLFLSRSGKPFGVSAFNTAWRRARGGAGVKRHEFHFHDIKAKAISDSPDLADAQARGDHADPAITKTVYRRKPAVVTPLPRVSGKKAS
jgi:integrase